MFDKADSYVFDEFVSGATGSGYIGALGWTLNGTGSCIYPDSEQNHPGILDFYTEPTPLATAEVSLQSTVISPGTSPFQSTFVFRPNSEAISEIGLFGASGHIEIYGDNTGWRADPCTDSNPTFSVLYRPGHWYNLTIRWDQTGVTYTLRDDENNVDTKFATSGLPTEDLFLTLKTTAPEGEGTGNMSIDAVSAQWLNLQR
jgi:hypothetical protein